MRRQRTQATRRSVDNHHPGGARELDRRARRQARRSAIPDPQRATPEQGCDRAAHRGAHAQGRPELPLPDGQTPAPPRPQAHLRRRTAPSRCRHFRDRSLAWSRRCQINEPIPARRPDHQGKSPRRSRPTHRRTGTLPALRHRPRLPRRPVTMPMRDPASAPDMPSHNHSPPEHQQTRHSPSNGIRPSMPISAYTVKANMPGLHHKLKKLPWKDIPANTAKTADRGRRVTRTIKVADVPDWLDFPAAAQVAQLRRTVTDKATKTVEVVYLITSAGHTDAPPQRLAAWVQGHWGIEVRREVALVEWNNRLEDRMRGG